MTLADDIQIEEFNFIIEPPTASDLSPDQPPSSTLDWSNDGTSFNSNDIWYWLGSTKAYVLDPQVVSPYTFSCSLTSLVVDESTDVMIDGMSFNTAADLTGQTISIDQRPRYGFSPASSKSRTLGIKLTMQDGA